MDTGITLFWSVLAILTLLFVFVAGMVVHENNVQNQIDDFNKIKINDIVYTVER